MKSRLASGLLAFAIIAISSPGSAISKPIAEARGPVDSGGNEAARPLLDDMTQLEIGAASASVVSFLFTAVGYFEEKQWRSEVREKLDQIVSKLDHISHQIGELHNLVKYQEATINRRAAIDLVRIAHSDFVDVAASFQNNAALTESQAANLRTIKKEANRGMKVLLDHGTYEFTAAHAVVVGAGIADTAARLLNEENETRCSRLDQAQRYVDLALDSSISYSLSAICSSNSNTRDAELLWLNAFPKSGGLGDNGAVRRAGRNCADECGTGPSYHYMVISGNADDGYAAAEINTSSSQPYGNFAEIEGISFGREIDRQTRALSVLHVLDLHRNRYVAAKKNAEIACQYMDQVQMMSQRLIAVAADACPIK